MSFLEGNGLKANRGILNILGRCIVFKNVNDLLAVIYLPFVLVWVVVVALIIKFLDISVVEALGLGTATGIILAILKDVYQFYFRKAPPTNGGSTPSG